MSEETKTIDAEAVEGMDANGDGHITKEEYEATLRSHQAAIDATKSAQRDAAEASGFFSS